MKEGSKVASNEAFSHEFVSPRSTMGDVMRRFWEIVNAETSPAGLALVEEAWLTDKLDGATADGQDRVSVYLTATWKIATRHG